MTDPLSITLAVISLSTTLKDIVELAQKVNDSFKKPGQNMRKAESLAAETLAIVQDLKKFHDGHKEILDNASDMQDAVLRLLKEMETVHDKCKPLLQVYIASDGTLRTWIKRKLGPWWKRNNVEESIQNALDGANKCRSDFMMFALMRIEAATAQVQAATAQVEATTAQTQATAVQIQATTIEIRTAVTNGFARPHPQPSNLQISDNNVLSFLGSTPIILSRLPPHVKLAEHLVYRESITLQVGKIGGLSKTLAFGGSYPLEEPDSLHLQPFRAVVWLLPSTEGEIEDLQFDVFAQIAKIHDSLKGRHDRQSIQRGAWAMFGLSVWLCNLKMYEESLTIAWFAVDLYRTLSTANSDVYGPRLAHALSLVSCSLVLSGDLVRAYQIITEAVALGRRLVASNPIFEAQMQLANLVRHSAHVGRQNGDLKNAIRDAEEAVEMYECLIGKFTSTSLIEENVVTKMGPPTVMTSEWTRLHDFANALKELHYSLSLTKRADESANAGIKAFKLYSALEKMHDHTDLNYLMADLCYSLASEEYQDVILRTKALSYAQQSVSRYEKILQLTGIVPPNLPISLARQAMVLSSLENSEEAYAVCQKLERVVQKHIDDQELRAHSLLQLTQNFYRLRRYVDAASTGEQLLATSRSLLFDVDLYNAYAYTSWALEGTGNNRKAVHIAESAVGYWRVLTFQDPENVKFLADSLYDLARQLLSAAEYGRAFSEGDEAMKLYSTLIAKDSNALGNYIEVLQLNMNIAKQAKKESRSVERSREVIHYSRALVEQFPDHRIFFIRLILDHATLLEESDQLAEGAAAIEEALNWFDAHPAPDPNLAELHTDSLLLFAKCLYDQGLLDKALSSYDKARRIGQPFLHVYPVAVNVFWARALNVNALYILGDVSRALADEIMDQLMFASTADDLEENGAHIWFLALVSLVYRCIGRVDYALPVVRWSIINDREQFRTPFSWILSDLIADSGDDEEALSGAYTAVQESEMWKSSSITTNKEIYITARYSLSLRLVANNKFTQAREVLVEVRSFYQEHSQSRNVWFIKLAITLWALGHLECASGQHEEGNAARTELDKLRNRLRLIFPRLNDLVEVGLRRERNFPAWRNLLEKFNLKCGHQEDILDNSRIANITISSAS